MPRRISSPPPTGVPPSEVDTEQPQGNLDVSTSTASDALHEAESIGESDEPVDLSHLAPRAPSELAVEDSERLGHFLDHIETNADISNPDTVNPDGAVRVRAGLAMLHRFHDLVEEETDFLDTDDPSEFGWDSDITLEGPTRLSGGVRWDGRSHSARLGGHHESHQPDGTGRTRLEGDATITPGGLNADTHLTSTHAGERGLGSTTASIRGDINSDSSSLAGEATHRRESTLVDGARVLTEVRGGGELSDDVARGDASLSHRVSRRDGQGGTSSHGVNARADLSRNSLSSEAEISGTRTRVDSDIQTREAGEVRVRFGSTTSETSRPSSMGNNLTSGPAPSGFGGNETNSSYPLGSLRAPTRNPSPLGATQPFRPSPMASETPRTTASLSELLQPSPERRAPSSDFSIPERPGNHSDAPSSLSSSSSFGSSRSNMPEVMSVFSSLDSSGPAVENEFEVSANYRRERTDAAGSRATFNFSTGLTHEPANGPTVTGRLSGENRTVHNDEERRLRWGANATASRDDVRGGGNVTYDTRTPIPGGHSSVRWEANADASREGGRVRLGGARTDESVLDDGGRVSRRFGGNLNATPDGLTADGEFRRTHSADGTNTNVDVQANTNFSRGGVDANLRGRYSSSTSTNDGGRRSNTADGNVTFSNGNVTASGRIGGEAHSVHNNTEERFRWGGNASASNNDLRGRGHVSYDTRTLGPNGTTSTHLEANADASGGRARLGLGGTRTDERELENGGRVSHHFGGNVDLGPGNASADGEYRRTYSVDGRNTTYGVNIETDLTRENTSMGLRGRISSSETSGENSRTSSANASLSTASGVVSADAAIHHEDTQNTENTRFRRDVNLSGRLSREGVTGRVRAGLDLETNLNDSITFGGSVSGGVSYAPGAVSGEASGGIRFNSSGERVSTTGEASVTGRADGFSVTGEVSGRVGVHYDLTDDSSILTEARGTLGYNSNSGVIVDGRVETTYTPSPLEPGVPGVSTTHRVSGGVRYDGNQVNSEVSWDRTTSTVDDTRDIHLRRSRITGEATANRTGGGFGLHNSTTAEDGSRTSFGGNVSVTSDRFDWDVVRSENNRDGLNFSHTAGVRVGESTLGASHRSSTSTTAPDGTTSNLGTHSWGDYGDGRATGGHTWSRSRDWRDPETGKVHTYRYHVGLTGGIHSDKKTRDLGPVSSDDARLHGTHLVETYLDVSGNIGAMGGLGIGTLGVRAGGQVTSEREVTFRTHVSPDVASQASTNPNVIPGSETLDLNAGTFFELLRTRNQVPDLANPETLQYGDELLWESKRAVATSIAVEGLGLSADVQGILEGEFQVHVRKVSDQKVEVSVTPSKIKGITLRGHAAILEASFSRFQAESLKQTFTFDLSSESGKQAYLKAIEGDLPGFIESDDIDAKSDNIEVLRGEEGLPEGVERTFVEKLSLTENEARVGFHWAMVEAMIGRSRTRSERVIASRDGAINIHTSHREISFPTFFSGEEKFNASASVRRVTTVSPSGERETRFDGVSLRSFYLDTKVENREFDKDFIHSINKDFGMTLPVVNVDSVDEKRAVTLTSELSESDLERLSKITEEDIRPHMNLIRGNLLPTLSLIENLKEEQDLMGRASRVQKFVELHGIRAHGILHRILFPNIDPTMQSNTDIYEKSIGKSNTLIAKYGNAPIQGTIPYDDLHARWKEVRATRIEVEKILQHLSNDPFLSEEQRSELMSQHSTALEQLNLLLDISHFTPMDVHAVWRRASIEVFSPVAGEILNALPIDEEMLNMLIHTP